MFKILFAETKTMKDSNICGSTTPCFDIVADQIIYDISADLNSSSKKLKLNEKQKEQLAYFLSIYNVEKYQAISLFDGLSFKRLDYFSLNDDAINYLKEHLLIASSLYGLLKVDDNISKYRLEMNYTKKYYKNILKDALINFDYIINISSNEFSTLFNNDNFINIKFMLLKDNKLVEQSTYSKIARGLFLRYLAQNEINKIEGLKKFSSLDFKYSDSLSDFKNYIYIKNI